MLGVWCFGSGKADILIGIRAAGDRAAAAGDTAGAVKILERGLNTDPGWKYGLWKSGLLLYQSERYTEARPYLIRLTAADAALGAGWALLGMYDFQLADYGASVEHLERADKLGIKAQASFRTTAGVNLALAYVETGDFDAAIAVLKRMVPAESAADREQIVPAFGYAATHQSIKAALSAAETAVVHRVGEAYYQSAVGDRPAARAVCRELLEKYPKATALHFVYANLLTSWLEREAAVAELKAELVNDPESYAARLALVYLALQTGDAPENLIWAREAARIRPDLYQPHFYLGQLLLRSDQAQEACTELEYARRLNPTLSGVRFTLAKVYRALGREAEAGRELKEFERLKALEEPSRAEHTAADSPAAPATP